MGPNISKPKGSNYTEARNNNNKRNSTRLYRNRSNTSPIYTRKQTAQSDIDTISSISRIKIEEASNSGSSSTLSAGSSNTNISQFNKSDFNIDNNSTQRIRKSTDRLSILPKYLFESLRNRDSKSLSPSVNRKSQQHYNSNNQINQNNIRFQYDKNSTKNILQNINNKMALRPKKNQIYEDYIISKEVLGLGISGRVLSCTNKKTKIKYALKTLRESTKAKREIDLHWRACQGCPYIVQIVDVYENVINTQNVILVVMECMEGGELFAKISERTAPFTEQEVAKMMHQICSAVKHLHSMSIAHRDLKPENLLLSTNDENAIIKLTDFGFAKEVNLGLVTPCYTPYYVAPEVLGSERYDISCDIWSLGVIMYILCCGYPPFYSTHGQPISPGMRRRIRAGEYAFPEAEWSRVSSEAKTLIQGMLQTLPENRSTINDIMRSHWISQFYQVPQTPLPTVEILREDRDNWSDVQLNMNQALDEMRINWENKVNIKELQIINNPLFERRMKKTKTENAPRTAAPTQPLNITKPTEQSKLIVEDLTREPSMMSVRSITPTNSRRASPERDTKNKDDNTQF